MKAILVIDVDEDMIGEVDYTVLSKVEMVNGRTELRPLPDMENPTRLKDGTYFKAYDTGWNDCLKEITGETE